MKNSYSIRSLFHVKVNSIRRENKDYTAVCRQDCVSLSVAGGQWFDCYLEQVFTADGRLSLKVTKKTGKSRKSTPWEEVVLEDVGAETAPTQGEPNSQETGGSGQVLEDRERVPRTPESGTGTDSLTE